MKKVVSALVSLCVLLLVQVIQLCLCGNSTIHCIEGERQALLRLKQSFEDPSNRLLSWTGEHCCLWSGIRCHKSSGHVVQLDLKTQLDGSPDESYASKQLSALEIDACLAELKQLEYLDLSGNDFNQSSIPKFIGSLKWVRYLNLSYAGLGGRIPLQLGNITSLQVIDLSFNTLLYADKLQWLSSLPSLQHLEMDSVDLSKAVDLMEVLTTLPSLQLLSLRRCGIQNIHFHRGYVNSTFLATVQFLDVSSNMLAGAIPDFLQNMTALRELDLSNNGFNSTVPLWLVYSKSLVHLSLSRNAFDNIEGGQLSENSMSDDLLKIRKNSSKRLSYDLEFLDLSSSISGGGIPDWLGHLKSLKFLDLSGNSLEGPIQSWLGHCLVLKELYLSYNKLNESIPESFGRLSLLQHLEVANNKLEGNIPPSLGNLPALKSLDLSQNQLTGIIPQSLGRLIHLEDLNLSDNQLNGTISHSIGRLSSLTSLDLSRNKLSGSVPISFGHLSNLLRLDISSNSLEGVVSEFHFSNLSLLEELNIGYNHLSFKVNSNWNPPFSLETLLMPSCSIGSQFPLWIKNQSKLHRVDLSDTNISGSLPRSRISSVPIMDLSRNQLTGNLPRNIVGTLSLNLGSNLLNGSIPDTICEVDELRFLDLSRNNLSGEIPECFGSLQSLEGLILSSNMLTGHIPSSISSIPFLIQLRLNNNCLDGELPLSLIGSLNLEILDVGGNRITGMIPTGIELNLCSLKVLRLHNNKFIGNIPLELCKLFDLKILDLALNNLSGGIPNCFSNFFQMRQHSAEFTDEDFPVQHVEVTQVIKGMECKYSEKQLRFLYTIDLSGNKLVGSIPEELGTLAGLRSLNLSHNNLSGKIPNRIGGLESIESLDLSNNQLFGEIPQSMAALMSLNHLNLSYNNLSGKIPTGNQLQTLDDPSIYVGNLQLYGFPLPKCLGEDEPAKPPINSGHEDEDDGEDKKDEILFWFIVVAGYATGLWAVIGTLVLKKHWRIAYFHFADKAKERILVMVAVKVAKLKQRMLTGTTEG